MSEPQVPGTPPSSSLTPTAPGRAPLVSGPLHMAPPDAGPLDVNGRTVAGIATNAVVPAPPVVPTTPDRPETLSASQLVTAGPPTGQPTAADGRAPTPATDNGLLTGVLFEGKYQVGRLLGEGGMGQVYQATHILMRKEVALKVLRPAMSVHSEIVERFRREAESAARLSHPNITSVLDFGRAVDGTFYLVMEFLVGASLTAALREGPMHWRRVCRLGIQMLSGLEEAHKAGVIHRDLKPDNIMLQVNAAGEESLKIVDFGIAKLLEDDGGPQLTATGLVFGTPSYLSPEQAQGRPVTHKADLYAMGIIFYQMLTRQVPFKAATTMELLAMHIQAPPPRVRDVVPEVPEALENLVLRSLAKKPDDRPADALEMRTVLTRALEAEDVRTAAPVTMRVAVGSPPVAPPPPPPPAPAPPPAPGPVSAPPARAFPVKKLVLGGLALCALGGLLYFVVSALSSEKPGKPAAPDTPATAGAQPAGGDAADGMTVANAGSKGAAPQSAPAVPRDRSKLDAALKLGDGARYSGNMTHIRKSIDGLTLALQNDPELKRDAALHAHLNANLLKGKHWHRQLTVKLVRELWAGASPAELKFLLTALNEETFDTEHRYEVFSFVRSRGLSEGLDEEGFWSAQLRMATSCRTRLEASEWFKTNGHRNHVPLLKGEAAKRSFRLGSGATQSTDCYRAVLQEAVVAAGARTPPNSR